MDLNYLYYRQQVEQMRADGAGCDCSRLSHQGLADLYGDLIEQRKAASQGK